MKKTAKTRQTIFSLVILILMLGLIAIMVIDLVPLLKQVLSDTHDETKMIDYINAYGAKGVPVLAGLQALQVMLTVIPAAAIQVLAGLCYGIWYGAVICIVGGILGNMIVFIVLRQVKSTFAALFRERGEQGGQAETVQSAQGEQNEQAESAEIGQVTQTAAGQTGAPKKQRFLSVATLNHLKHPEYISFFFYLIPGIPNGILPYIFARTRISIGKYLLSVSAASIPSVLLMTWLGERISKGDYKTAIILAAIFVVILTIVLIFRKKITNKIEQSLK
jgi:uncharacterized membrane protein YdjX (TVP38/TMEM64 family)